MSTPPSFDPHNSQKIRARGVIIIAAIVVAFIVAVLLIKGCSDDEKKKTPVAVPAAPGQPRAPAQGSSEDPTAQPSSGDSTEDYADELNVAGAKTLNIKVLAAGPQPRIIAARLGDKVRFVNLQTRPIRVASADTDVPYAFDTGLIEYKRSRVVTLRGVGQAKYTIAPAIIGYGGDSTEAVKPEDVKVLFGTINILKR